MRSTSPPSPARFPTSPLWFLALALAVLPAHMVFSPTPAEAQCGAPACMGSPMGGMSCTITWMNPTSMCPGLYLMGACFNATNQMTVANVAMANHTPGQPLTATCEWNFISSYFYTTRCSQVGVAECQIDSLNGLPVELMDFSVEPASEEAEPDSGDPETEASGEGDA